MPDLAQRIAAMEARVLLWLGLKLADKVHKGNIQMANTQ